MIKLKLLNRTKMTSCDGLSRPPDLARSDRDSPKSAMRRTCREVSYRMFSGFISPGMSQRDAKGRSARHKYIHIQCTAQDKANHSFHAEVRAVKKVVLVDVGQTSTTQGQVFTTDLLWHILATSESSGQQLKMIQTVAHLRIASLLQDAASLYTVPYGACKKLPGQDRSKGLFQSRWILPQDNNPYHDALQKPAAHSRKIRKVPKETHKGQMV